MHARRWFSRLSRPVLSRLVLRGLIVPALVAAGALAAAAQDTPPDDRPFHLDLDTGGHRAFIKDITFSPDGEYLLTASDDKTIRIWDWRSGVTVRTLRGFVGDDNDGKVFALAISPDGKTVAAGGYFGPGIGQSPPYGNIRLFDFGTGRMLDVLKAPQLTVYDVQFSPDGSLLAAAGQDGLAYLWQRDGDGWKEAGTLDAESNRIEKIAFVLGGKRLAAVTTDYGIRLWDVASGQRIDMADAQPLDDISVTALAATPDGARFATGTVGGVIQVWDAASGSLTQTLPSLGFQIGALTFAGPDRIVASCGYRCTDKHRTLVLPLDGGAPLEFRAHDGTVYASAASPDGSMIATAGGRHHSIRVWNPTTGAETKAMQGRGEPVAAVGIDERTQEIAWGNADPCPDRIACPEVLGVLDHRLLLPTADRFFETPQPLGNGEGRFLRSMHDQDGWSLAAASGGDPVLENGALEISHDGKLVRRIENDATNGFLHAAFSLFFDGHKLVTGGSDGTLLEYATIGDGALTGAFTGGHTGEINAIAISEKLNLMLTGSADQTLRLWNLQTRELIVSMFFAGKEFVVWMPQGYYYASDDGDNLIGWHVNGTRDEAARFVRAAQLKRYLWSPEMVRRAIVLRSAAAAVQEMRPGVDHELEKLLQRKPPEFDIRVADDQSNTPDGFVAVEVSGAEDSGVSEFTVLANSRNVSGSASRSVSGDGTKQVLLVPIQEGENRISVTGVNEFGYVTERGATALGKPRQATVRKGKLYLVIVGANQYPLLQTACSGKSCDLRYPVADAAGFASTIAEKSAGLYTGMETLVLVNRESLDESPAMRDSLAKVVPLASVLEPEADSITDELADFLEKPTKDDTTIVFVAGHGINVGEDYYFIPSDGRTSDNGEFRRSSLVDWGDIQKAVERAEGTRLMLLDTCHAANAFNPRLEKDAADSRIVVFSATAANSTAQERTELGHGVFTYAVLNGLRGDANTSGDGVRLLGLADYIYREVTRITQEQQKPFYYISNMENILLAEP